MNQSDKPMPGMFDNLEGKLTTLNDILTAPIDFVPHDLVEDVMLAVYETCLLANVLSREELKALHVSGVPVSPEALNSLPGANNAIRAFLAGCNVAYRDLSDARTLVGMVHTLSKYIPKEYFTNLCYKAFPIRKK